MLHEFGGLAQFDLENDGYVTFLFKQGKVQFGKSEQLFLGIGDLSQFSACTRQELAHRPTEDRG